MSELRKGPGCDPGVSRWLSGIGDEDLFLSALTIGEIRKGIESLRRRDSGSADVLEVWLRELLEDNAPRILPVDIRIAEEWGRMSVPDPLPVIDGLLAATARVHKLTLVTRNVKDMARTGVPCLDPFHPRA